ncbi:restriction endonuclease subunit S [Halorubellus sp. PRR65]|uniref:restriction endonuclease subunit S n=1 Tax=Halorubellus sp. PRR65 TaxID=3098148 RepID=UPI002B263F5D|nr:restriction endonuclease subunit S [Halorubellus sp. PRR65]
MSETVKERREVPEGYSEVQLGPKSDIIPEDWGIESLSNWLSSLETGGRPKTSERSESDSVLSIGGAHISDGSFNLEEPVYISNDYYEGLNSGKISRGDILLVKDGATIGKSTYVNSVPEGNAAVNSHVYILRVEPQKYDSQFLYNFINSRIGLDQILRLTTGSAQAGLNRTFQQAVKVPTPQLPEQRRIADILSTVNEQIQQTDEIIGKTKELKRGLIQDLFEKGISSSEFTEVHVGPREYRLPKNWTIKQISDAIDENIITGHQDGNHGNQYPRKDEFVDEGVPYLSANMLTGGRVDFSEAKFLTPERVSQLRIGFAEDGDVLLAHNATVGRCAILETDADTTIIGTSLTYFRCNNDELHNKYLMAYFQSELFQNQLEDVMGQSTRNQVPITRQRNLDLVLPPVDEQRRIADILSLVDEKLQEEKSTRDDLQELKRGLMQDLLTGKVRVNTND